MGGDHLRSRKAKERLLSQGEGERAHSGLAAFELYREGGSWAGPHGEVNMARLVHELG